MFGLLSPFTYLESLAFALYHVPFSIVGYFILWVCGVCVCVGGCVCVCVCVIQYCNVQAIQINIKILNIKLNFLVQNIETKGVIEQNSRHTCFAKMSLVVGGELGDQDN